MSNFVELAEAIIEIVMGYDQLTATTDQWEEITGKNFNNIEIK